MAYIYTGMQNLSDFIADMVLILPTLIPLIVVGVIIATVYVFGNYIKGILKLR